MANAVIPFDQEQETLPSIYGDYLSDLDDLAAGISSGFAVVSFRGKAWRVKWQGEETLIRDKKKEPVRKLSAIIVGVSPALSKTFYEGAYEPGSTDNPDCASADGIRPDPGVPNRQSDLCANCPNNQFGSQITASGSKAKACSDHKRLAIVPAADVRNEAFGGPMLLRIPPASLQNLVAYVNLLKTHRVPPFAVVTEISFDPEAEFPKLVLTPVGKIQDNDILQTILEVRGHTSTDSILNGMSGGGSDLLPAIPGPKQQPKAVTKPKAAAGTQPARRKATPVQEAEEVEGGEGEEGDGEERSLMPEVVQTEGEQTEGEGEPVSAEQTEDDEGEDGALDLTVGVGSTKTTVAPTKAAAAPKANGRKAAAAPPKTLTPRAETALTDLLGGLS